MATVRAQAVSVGGLNSSQWLLMAAIAAVGAIVTYLFYKVTMPKTSGYGNIVVLGASALIAASAIVFVVAAIAASA